MTSLIETEHEILSVGRKFLPPEAIKVLDGAELTLVERATYATWLAEQIGTLYDECECEVCAKIALGGFASTQIDSNACETLLASQAADAARDAAIDALRESDEPREYEITDDGASWTITSKPSTLEADIKESVREGDWQCSSSWVWDGYSKCALTGEEDSHTVEMPAKEPTCTRGKEHDWQSPHEVLGGLEENPGVFGGPNGGVTVREVCAHCGVYRVFVSRKTNPTNGTTYEAIDYEDADEDSLAWVTSFGEE